MKRRTLALLGGFGAPAFVQLVAPELESNDCEVLPLQSPRHSQHKHAPRGGYPWSMLRIALDINSQLGQQSGLIGVAHSLGCIAMVIAALLKKKFRAVVLVAPAGLIKSDNFTRLLWRANAKNIHSFTKAWQDPSLGPNTRMILWQNIRYFKANPVRAIQEAWCVATYRLLLTLIQRLRDNGTKVFVILANDDKIFPLKSVEWIAAYVDGIRTVPGQHDLHLYLDTLIDAILSLVDSMDTNAPGGGATA